MTTPGPGTRCSPPPTPPWAPWYIAHTDDKKRGRLNIISHLLSQVPYKPLAPRDITLPRAAAARRLRGAGPAAAVHPDTVLDSRIIPDGDVEELSPMGGEDLHPRRVHDRDRRLGPGEVRPRGDAEPGLEPG